MWCRHEKDSGSPMRDFWRKGSHWRHFMLDRSGGVLVPLPHSVTGQRLV